MYSGIIDACGPCAWLSFVMTPEKQGPELLTVCCEDCQQRQVGIYGDTWYKWIERSETVELCWHSNLPSCLCETDHWVCVKQPTVLLFCDIHFNIGTAQH